LAPGGGGIDIRGRGEPGGLKHCVQVSDAVAPEARWRWFADKAAATDCAPRILRAWRQQNGEQLERPISVVEQFMPHEPSEKRAVARADAGGPTVDKKRSAPFQDEQDLIHICVRMRTNLTALIDALHRGCHDVGGAVLWR
jgi:hypothetical protein